MLTPVDRILWAFTISANALLLTLVLKGRHYRLFPNFAIYNGFTLLKSIVLIFSLHNLYFFVYYVGTFFSTALLVLVTLEIASDLFAPYSTIPVKNVINLLGASIVAGIIALALSEFIGFHPHPEWWARLLTLDKFCKFILVGALSVIIYIAYDLGLPWFKHTRGLAAGLFFSSILQGIIQMLPQTHTRPFFMLAFIVAQLVWIHTFFNRWAEPIAPSAEELNQMLYELRK